METLGIVSFEDLIAHLDGLVEAAREAEVGSEATHFVATIRTRLVRIRNFLEGAAPKAEPEVTPKAKTVTSTEDLISQFVGLTEAARSADLGPTFTRYLHTARLRLHFLLSSRSGKNNRRLVHREQSSGTARMRWPKGEMEVEVVDRSAYGMGVMARELRPENTVVEIIWEEEGHRRRYYCLVVNGEPHRFQYYLNLETFLIKG